MTDWQNKLTSERMQLDQEFESEVAASDFSRQQWSLIMTAVEFDIEHPDDPEQARLVANTDKLPSVMGELDKVDRSGMPGAGGGRGGGRGGGGSGGGLLGGLKSALGLDGGSGGGDQLAAAEELAQAYAEELQSKLEQRGKWDRIRDDASAD